MHTLPPAPEPADDDLQPEPKADTHWAYEGSALETPVDISVDAIRQFPDGRTVVLQFKRFIRPTLDPGGDWKSAVRQRLSVRPDDRALPVGELSVYHLGEESAQNATAAASGAFLLAASVLEGTPSQAAYEASEDLIRRLRGQVGRVEVRWSTDEVDTHSVAAWLTPGHARRVVLEPVVVGTVDQGLRLTDTVLEKKLTELMSHWHEVAYRPVLIDQQLQRPGRSNRERRHEALCAVAAARQARQAALQTRDTVVTRPWRDSKEAVARFAEDWLNLQPTDGLVEAAANALLFASLDDPDPEDVDPEGRALLGQLRKETIRQRRALRLLGDTQLCGRFVDYFNRETRLDGESVGHVGQNLTASQTVEDVVFRGMGQWKDGRIARVLARLKPDERRVAITYAEEGCTWTEAASACELPVEFGERVRRKLHRLGRQLLERTSKSAA